MLKKRYVIVAQNISDDQEHEIYESHDIKALLAELQVQLSDDTNADFQFTIRADFQPLQGL